MGAHKPLLRFGKGKLIDAVIARVAPQVDKLAIDAPPSRAGDYAYDNVLPDLFAQTLGPLCGIVTGLEWLDAELLATFPCDTPFLPRDLVAQLAKHPAPVAVKNMPVCGLWPKRCLPRLREELHAHGGVRRALQAAGGREVAIDAPEHAFFNVNAPEDLQEALRLSARED